MAPEIHLDQGYHGQAVDLFAAGVVLFILVTGRSPFIRATSQDDYYKAIIANRTDLFWKIHQKKSKCEKGLVSKNLMEMINFMLAFDPIERASLSEIRQHPWCQEPSALQDEIVEEFTKRLKFIEQEALNNDKPIPSSMPDSDAYSIITDKEVTRGIFDEELKVEVTKRCIKEYNHDLNKFTKFFSSSSLENLYYTLASFVKNYTTEYEFESSDYS